MAAFLFTLSFTACDDDDDDDGGRSSNAESGSTTAKYYISEFNAPGTSMGNVVFTYDSDGNLTKIVEYDDETGLEDDTYSITYDPMTVTISEGGEIYCTMSDIGVNSNRYITGYTLTYIEDDEDCTVTCTYSGTHLSMLVEENNYGVEKEMLTWDDDLLIGYAYSYSDYDGDSDSGVWTYIYEDYKYENKMMQYTYGTWDLDPSETHLIMYLAWTGFFGEGSSYLPDEIDEEGERGSYVCGFNDDGTVAYESEELRDYDVYTFSYY